MRALIMVYLFLAGITSAQAGEFDLYRLSRNPLPTIEVAVRCVLELDYISGSNKFCVYDCMGSKTTTTISADKLCPINIDR